MRMIQGIVLSLSVLIATTAFALAQMQPTVLIAFYSREGHTKAMAEAVERGARSVQGVTVKLMAVGDVKNDDLLNADAIIVGSPVYNANIAPEVVQFVNSWPFDGAPLMNKIGAAFVTGGGISAGEELAQMSILHPMLLFGMIVVGGADWTSAFGASAITFEMPFDKPPKETLVAEQFLKKGEGLGRRVAELAARWKSRK